MRKLERISKDVRVSTDNPDENLQAMVDNQGLIIECLMGVCEYFNIVQTKLYWMEVNQIKMLDPVHRTDFQKQVLRELE